MDLENRTHWDHKFRFRAICVSAHDLPLTNKHSSYNCCALQYYKRELEIYKDIRAHEIWCTDKNCGHSNIVRLIGMTEETLPGDPLLESRRYPFFVLPFYSKGSMSGTGLKHLSPKLNDRDKIKMVRR